MWGTLDIVVQEHLEGDRSGTPVKSNISSVLSTLQHPLPHFDQQALMPSLWRGSHSANVASPPGRGWISPCHMVAQAKAFKCFGRWEKRERNYNGILAARIYDSSSKDFVCEVLEKEIGIPIWGERSIKKVGNWQLLNKIAWILWVWRKKRRDLSKNGKRLKNLGISRQSEHRIAYNPFAITWENYMQFTNVCCSFFLFSGL